MNMNDFKSHEDADRHVEIEEEDSKENGDSADDGTDEKDLAEGDSEGSDLLKVGGRLIRL